jgi:hypothetical protein
MHWDCNQQQTADTLYHVLFECQMDDYLKHRPRLIETVQRVYEEHNEIEEKKGDDGEVIDFDEYSEIYDPKRMYMKQFIYPPHAIKVDLRVRIFKAIKFYLINTRKENMELIPKKRCMNHGQYTSMQRSKQVQCRKMVETRRKRRRLNPD